MPVPLNQALRVGAYVVRQHLRGRRALSAGADAGAAVPLQPRLRRLRQDRLSRRRSSTSASRSPTASAAVDECGAPVVAIAGGEPLLHKEMPQIVQGMLARGKFVYLCTNALLLEKKLDQYKPHRNFAWDVHLDGDREMHDHAVSQDGVFDRAVARDQGGEGARLPRLHQHHAVRRRRARPRRVASSTT